MRWFFNLLLLLTFFYQVALLIYFAIGYIKPAQSRFTHFLSRIIEPLLVPLRRILTNVLPSNWQRLDWSPVAALLVIWLVREFLTTLARMFG